MSRNPYTPARRYAKEVTITADHYRRTHGRNPRGYGVWMFAPAYAANEQTPAGEPLPPEQAQEQLHQTATAYRGTYAQARAQAARDAAAKASQPGNDAAPRQLLTLATLP